MFHDVFYKIHDGEIFAKSRCMYRERETIDVLHNLLVARGYTQAHNKQIWTRGQTKVIVCLADDFIICDANRNKPASHWFDSNTTVITDGHMPHSADYRIMNLPSSYFGVFNYVPELQTFDPIKRFGLSINRVDSQRILTFLELIYKSGGLTQTLEKDLINFNCFNSESANLALIDLQERFFKYWNQIGHRLGNRYTEHIADIVESLPVRNHNLSIEQAHVSSYITLVVETYAGNNTITFSEKIFRALVTPAPWMLFGSRGAVQYLKTLEFDVMDDLIDHSYDSRYQHFPGLAKISNFYEIAEKNYQKLLSMEFSTIRDRCLTAAIRNQHRLAHFQKHWPEDFDNFLSKLKNEI
jgi:hypothetical protein